MYLLFVLVLIEVLIKLFTRQNIRKKSALIPFQKALEFEFQQLIKIKLQTFALQK